MKITQERNGVYVITDDDGRVLINKYYSGEMYTSVYEEGLTIRENDLSYRYTDVAGRKEIQYRMSDSGIFEQYAYDPYGNVIGYWRSPRSNWETNYIKEYTYRYNSAGEVVNDYKGSTSYTDYDKWLRAMPVEFPVEEYVAPKVRYTKSGQMKPLPFDAGVLRNDWYSGYSIQGPPAARFRTVQDLQDHEPVCFNPTLYNTSSPL